MNNKPKKYIETDVKKICLKLINEMKIVPVYDHEKDITTFSFEFPPWLKKNYTPETVEYLINIVTPIIVQEMNHDTNKECFQIIKEDI